MEARMPFYHIINIFLPGLVFVGSLVLLFFGEVEELFVRIANFESFEFEILITVICLAIAYQVGYVIFRLGAAVIGPALKKMFDWRDYPVYVQAKKNGAEKSLGKLSHEYAYARTHITPFIIFAAIVVTSGFWILFLVCAALVLLFGLTARSSIKKIVDITFICALRITTCEHPLIIP